MGILAGVAAGLLGIGGGMVIGPLFITLDMQPKVGSSSCAFMILWTALSGVVQYAFAGKLGWQFILWRRYWSGKRTDGAATRRRRAQEIWAPLNGDLPPWRYSLGRLRSDDLHWDLQADLR